MVRLILGKHEWLLRQDIISGEGTIWEQCDPVTEAGKGLIFRSLHQAQLQMGQECGNKIQGYQPYVYEQLVEIWNAKFPEDQDLVICEADAESKVFGWLIKPDGYDVVWHLPATRSMMLIRILSAKGEVRCTDPHTRLIFEKQSRRKNIYLAKKHGLEWITLVPGDLGLFMVRHNRPKK